MENLKKYSRYGNYGLGLFSEWIYEPTILMNFLANLKNDKCICHSEDYKNVFSDFVIYCADDFGETLYSTDMKLCIDGETIFISDNKYNACKKHKKDVLIAVLDKNAFDLKNNKSKIYTNKFSEIEEFLVKDTDGYRVKYDKFVKLSSLTLYFNWPNKKIFDTPLKEIDYRTMKDVDVSTNELNTVMKLVRNDKQLFESINIKHNDEKDYEDFLNKMIVCAYNACMKIGFDNSKANTLILRLNENFRTKL